MDAKAIRAFRCGQRPWYVTDAAKVVRRSASVLGTSASAVNRTRVLLFEIENKVMAISVLQQAHNPQTADLVVLAVHQDVQGAWLEEDPPRPLCVAALEETAHFAAGEGYERILAMAAEQNTKSVRLITRAGFVRVTGLNGDYVLYQISLPPLKAWLG
ncbi:MAG: hypothetical protein ACRDK2_15410 [Solirubrobacteraceae bacterium]